MSRLQYVAGLAFKNDKVLLIRKNRPAWQAGRLNGIGGKIEEYDLGPYAAQVREFREETGIHSAQEDWHIFDVEKFQACDVFWHYSKSIDISAARSMTDEIVGIHDLTDILNWVGLGSSPYLYNLPYLVAKAYTFATHPEAEMPKM